MPGTRPKSFFYLLLYLWLPSLLTGLTGTAVSLKYYPVADTLRSLTLDALLLALLLLLPAKVALVVLVALFIPLLLLTVGNVMHTVLYKAPISPFAFQSMFETSSNEYREFISEFATVPNTLIIVAVIAVSIWVFRLALRHNAQIRRTRKTAVFALVVLAVCSFFVIHKGDRLLRSHVGYVACKSMFEFERDKETISKIQEQRKKNTFEGVSLLDGDPDAKRCYVIIVGESSNRNHMSLYGYHRKTNPVLEGMSEQLFVFTDIISCRSHTVPSLRQALLFHQLDAPEGEDAILRSRSLPGLFNNAGFDTYWLSNQTANSDGLTGTAVLAGDAAHARFFNKARNEGNSVSHDNVLLPALNDVLDNPAPRKVIFLHLIGSHMSYGLRYPGEFAFFNSTADLADAPWRDDESKQKINEYDNSIRYTDTIVAQVIEAVGKREGRNMVVYFSDHGQEVYDTLPIRGQSAEKPSRNMYDIPFICWFSDAYREANKDFLAGLAKALGTPTSLSDFVYMAADLTRVGSTEFRPEDSPFSPGYLVKRRELPYKFTYEELPRLVQGMPAP